MQHAEFVSKGDDSARAVTPALSCKNVAMNSKKISSSLWIFSAVASEHKTIDMKKQFIVATALLASTVTFAQQDKKAPPAPPPPPKVEMEKFTPPPPPPEVPEVVVPNGYSDFLTRNKNVKTLEWNNQRQVTIHLKSGNKEVYDLGNTEQVKKLEDKYGQLPEAPPPPPPPPAPPAKPVKRQ